jgi:hypothetical protein
MDEGANVATAYSLADAILLVRTFYQSSGARILIAGSVYQAGAASIILGASDSRSKERVDTNTQ